MLLSRRSSEKHVVVCQQFTGIFVDGARVFGCVTTPSDGIMLNFSIWQRVRGNTLGI